MARYKPYALSGLAVIVVGIIISCAVTPTSVTGDVGRMDKDELKALLDNPDIVILDVRTSSDWNRSEYKIKGAHRLDQSNADKVETMYPKDKTIVTYCS